MGGFKNSYYKYIMKYETNKFNLSNLNNKFRNDYKLVEKLYRYEEESLK